MADRNLVQELKRWATQEFNLPPDSLPNDGYFKTLCVGTGKSIWKYVIQHVLHQRNVRVMRGNLQWYKALQAKELKQAEGQSEDVKQRELQRKIEELKAEIGHLDSQISGAEEQLATQEQFVTRTWAQVEDSQHRELLLRAFKQRCAQGCKTLSDDTQNISGHCQALDQMARKAEIEILFDEPSTSVESDNLKTTAEARVLREVRELCDDRIHFYQSLQESELKMHSTNSAAKRLTPEQRTTMFHYWLSAVENVLGGYPPNHVLSALQYLASCEQKELEDKLASLDVTKDVTALRFRHESNHLLDMSNEEAELPPVKALLQDAWEDVEQSLVELAQTRSRVLQLKNQLQTCKKEAKQEFDSTDELHNVSMALSVLDLELQCVMQEAFRDHVRDRCIQLDQHARSHQEALRNLHSQWQSILDFRQLVVLRQEQIRGLIKGNSSAKTELIHLHRQLQAFIQSKVVPQFEGVTAAASNLRNLISKDAKQFGMVSLLSLDHRTIEGSQKIPASSMSIHRVLSPTFSNMCHSLAFPLYKAPEELCFQARSQQHELRFLHQLLQLHTVTLQKTQRETEMLHASDQKALLSRVVEEDQKLLNSLVPRVKGLTQRCAQGLSYGDQVRTAISFWWDQPAQHVLPEAIKGGLTYQQWLQRWKLAANGS